MRYRAVLLVLFLSLLLIESAGVVPSAEAASAIPAAGGYSCGGPGTITSAFASHCYGQVIEYAQDQLIPGTNFMGVRMLVDAQPLWDRWGAVTNEVWLADTHEPGNCHVLLFFGNGTCWIELGVQYNAFVPWQGTHFFWADVRPSNGGCGLGCGYNEHDEPTLLSSDVGSNKVAFLEISYAGGGSWGVHGQIRCLMGICGGTSFNMASTNNTMLPDSFTMGQELIGSGTSGLDVIAPKVDFRQTQVQAYTGSNWYFITNNGTVQGANPPWAGWDSSLTPTLYGHGGVFYTCSKAYHGRNPC